MSRASRASGIYRVPIVVSLFLGLAVSQVKAQITIGGNVYGGGNEGEVEGSTTVTIRDGLINKVFGGGRIADVGGRAFVNLDGENADSITGRILIGSVYGGNDISGTVGTAVSLSDTGKDMVPDSLTDVLRGSETLASNPEKNDINNSWSAFVRSSKMKGVETFDHAIIVGSVYGGGNGDYTYDSADDFPTAGKTTHYIKDKLTGDTIATTVTNTGEAGFTEPELAKAYLEINGGCLSQVYGGGNMATVTNNTVISMDNTSKGLQELIPAQQPSESDSVYRARLMGILYQLSDFTGLSMFQGNFSSINYTSSRVFGGNNQATMTIHPHWNLKNGKIRDLYSGGNEGDMTNSYGLLLEIPARSNINVFNVYGGCRRANVHPLRNGSEVPSTDVQLPDSLGYHFPSGLSARVLVHGGDVTNVYGGNDISGRVWGGTAIGVYTSIRGDVYGGGNGSYAYTNNPDLKNDPNYKDFYFEVPTGKTTVEALNDHRPHVEQTSLRLWGESPEHRTIIGGSVFVGGNSATVIENPTLTKPIIELKIGSNVIADNVFLGNNGVQMIGQSAENVLQIYKSTVTDWNGNSKQYSTLDLTDAVTVAEYMEGCAMSLHPRIVFDNTENGDPDTYVPYSSYFGSFFCGGNVGSMTWPGTTTIDVDDPIIIFDKFVTGCNNAYMDPVSGYSNVYWGGLTGSSAEMQEHGMENPDGTIKDAVIMNLSGLKIQPKRWVTKRDANYDPVLSADGKPIYLATDGCELATINAVCTHGKQPYLEWNTYDKRTGKDVASPTELTAGATRNSTADDVNRRLKGGNIYGGCYAAGFVNGNVVFNINESIMDRDEVFSRVQEDDEGEEIYYNNTEYHITKVNSGVIIDEQGMDVLGKSLNIFGGGYGAGTEIWGSTTINLNKGYTFQVFGGAEKGIIGIPVTTYTNGVAEYPTTTDPDGTIDWTNNTYAFNGYLYHIDERCSTYINLNGAQAGVSRHSDHDTSEMAETEFIYGGAFVGPIMGSTNVYLGNGRIFNSFAGSCNADIMGHTETYVGLNAAGNAGFPFIRDHIYGGNDLGGKIYGSKDFLDRVREDVSGIKDNIYDKDHSTVASAYVEYQQGRVDYIFGGCYGTYDYTDSEFKDYFYTTGGEGTTTANLGKARPGYSKPYLGNAFVNFRPVVSSIPLDKALRVYGAGQGITGEKEIDVLQDRSYVLIDIPQTMTQFHDLEVFGAGSSCGLGMNAPAPVDEVANPGDEGSDAEKEAYQKYLNYQDYLANPDAYSAVIDLFRGDISEGNVYGGSFTEGVTRRTVVNVPPVSTIKANNIFGGAYGVTNERPCDVYEAIVNYNSDNALMSGSIYGGNNAYRRTFYGKVNISSPVWTNKTAGYTATVYGAGYGEDTWSQYTEVNLNNGASVYEVYGGGQKGKVLNLESVNAWKTELESIGQTLYTDISPDPNSDYTDRGLDSDVANYSQLEIDRAAEITNIEDSWRNIGTTYTKKKYNTNVSIKEGATVDGYCYGGGLGFNNILTSGDVYGTTYIDLLGGKVTKDLYGAGTTGAVMDGKKVASFIASANVYIKGGTVRNCYGGGWEGPVGYHDESTTATTDDILGETHVVIGVLDGPCTPNPALTYTNGIPTVQRNAYGGGEGGVIYGTANITLNNGYVGYVYNASGSDVAATDDFDEHYEEKIADETYDDGNGAGNNERLLRAGNVFGSGYADHSNADFTNVYLYGGVVRNSAYGGGEIGTVGRGSNSNGSVTVHKPGESHVFMYKGHVMQDVFGGGRGFDNLNRFSNIGTGGYVFGLTDVNIFGGEVGTADGVKDGYGNVFGGGNLGFVYSGYGKKGESSIANWKTTSTEGYYYKYDSANNRLAEENGENVLTEDCRVIVAPACQVLCGDTITLNGHEYTAGQYVPAEDMNFLLNKNAGGDDWAKLDASDNHSGVTIRNAVFAGGNVSSGSDQVYANTVTVYGNATATLYDIFNRDLITIGTEHVGGLYGDGNLTFVDGYRELNVSNYGTDFYGLSDNISLDDYYHKLTDRERAYFTLEYKCKEAYRSDVLNKSFDVGNRIKEEDYKLITDSIEQNKWELLGFCTIYAGRLLNTLQRADFVGVFGSRMVLQGAMDRVPSVVDYTNYTINRVGELSLNKCDSQAGDTDANASHGSYFGIYNIVNYLGALTSDVDFTEVRTIDNTDAQYNPDSPNQTYEEWKVAHITERKRNNGTSHNKVALASGVYLELTTEESTADNKVWGLVTGVCQLDLISVVPGIGGGYVYAKNEHGTRQSSGNDHTILSPYNMAGYGHAKAVTNKIYTYNSTLNPYETSGNFIHNQKHIIDDCYPTSGSYSGTDAAPAHYWYIRGEIYVYDQYISAYTGSASAYSESINLPLTITPGSNGVLQLSDVKENFYAYYDKTTSGSETKIGEDGILLGTTTYHLNDPITYWDYYLLSAEDRKHFVKETYTIVEKCKIGGVVYNVGDAMLLSDVPSSTSEALVWVGGDTNGEWKQVEGKDVNYLVRLTNNLAHNTGYALTYDMTNPKVWDRYFTPPTGASIADNVAGKVTTSKYNDNPSSYSTYIGAPTYTPTTSGVYGQRDYEVGDIIPSDIQAKYEAIETNGHSYPGGQATVARAYVATDEVTYTIDTGTEAVEHHVYKGYAIPKSEYDLLASTTQAKFAEANVCTSTIELGNNEFIYYGDLLTDAEMATAKTAYITFLESQGIDPGDAATKADADFATTVLNAYYCTRAGKYGGDWYEAAKNYRAVEAWSSMSEADRAHFTFNYDAFDTLIDPDFAGLTGRYDGYDSNNDQLQELYSALTPVDYKATYNDTTNDLTYTDENGATKTVAAGATIEREVFEDIPNEKRFYQAISIPSESVGTSQYIVKVPFTRGETPYTVGTVLSESIFNSLDDDQQQYVMQQTFTAPGTYYFCRKPYTINANGEGHAFTDINNVGHASGSEVTVGTIITEAEYGSLPNKQANFTIHGEVPIGTSTLYVSRESDINDLSKDKVITVIYDYTYEESDLSGNNIEEITEKHVINIHLQFKSGVPSISELEKPAIVLPNSTVGLKQPNVTPGAFEIIGGGWEMFTNQTDAEHHTNGIPYFNNLTPMYWYQNDYYVAYYARSYLGKTYSNFVQFTVANYHDLDAVMNHERHLFVDHKDVDRPCKIYIDNRECTDNTKSELDLLKDFFDLTLQNTMDEDGNPTTISDPTSAVNGHKTVDEYIKGGANLEFFLKSDVAPKAYTTWTPIGDGTQCFQGTLHGNGYTISGLSNSLFGSLCGDVYNLGVTGSFTSAGIVDEGSGYVENCWISTTGTPAPGVRAVMNTPTRGSGTQIVNCYYPADNNYDETSHAQGDAIKKPRQSFYNGEVAYNLNGFYLNKRYNDHLATMPDGYSADGNPSHPYYRYFDADDLDENNKPKLKVSGYEAETAYTLGYVEEYYEDGDFIYSGGHIPETDNERYSTTYGKHYPIWPDDYIFFGQMLTYGHVASRPHQNMPAHINKSGDRLTTTATSVNRVYRAPAYFRNSNMGVAYYNPYAVFAAKSADNTHTAYPNMTAIDFTGGNGDLAGTTTTPAPVNGNPYKKGLCAPVSTSEAVFYPPLLDNDGLTYFRNVDLTRNLLAYTPASTGNDHDANTKTYSAVMAALADPTYAEGSETGTGYVAGKSDYRTVAAQDATIIYGHAVVQDGTDYTATSDHFLVDRHDFNAPIAYTFASGKRMWHQRTPDNYVDRVKGWEAISLPFEVELVTTNQKGEISHFYQDNTIGHEYWLREFSGGGTTEGSVYKGIFNYPAKGIEDKSYTNTFLWDYYYQEGNVVRPDAHNDKYDWNYYSTTKTLEDYPLAAAAKPYIIGFPGTTYYEFDLSGRFNALNTLNDVSQLRKQVITFASEPGITINVSDTEISNGKVTADGYIFHPSYLNESFAAGTDTYTLNANYDSDNDATADCSSFVKVPATGDATTVQAFRPYFTKASSGVKGNNKEGVKYISFNRLNSQFGNDEEQPEIDDRLEGELIVKGKRGRIIVESRMTGDTSVHIVTAGGALVRTFEIAPDETVETHVAPGVYIVNKKKISIK
ncbi:MAG: hypothetical protein J6W75_00980 [Bacteroidaceae bacterium]|nr:hypothetical protein [Bacteroidales bacterium]MBP5769923.1 hypothetical protein [Bacteroidaceae bacterium]